MNSKKTIFIAASPSGGHIKPAKAVADMLKKRHPELEIVFLITGKPLERRILKNYILELVKSLPFSGTGLFNKLLSGTYMVYALKDLVQLFNRYSPSLVISGGGYVSVSVTLFAGFRRIPVVALE